MTIGMLSASTPERQSLASMSKPAGTQVSPEVTVMKSGAIYSVDGVL